jgi:hypothetical protein
MAIVIFDPGNKADFEAITRKERGLCMGKGGYLLQIKVLTFFISEGVPECNVREARWTSQN